MSIRKAEVIEPVLPFVTVSMIFSFLSVLMIGLRSTFTNSRLPLQTDCSHCISANTSSSLFFSIARSIRAFAYLDANLGFGILIQFHFCHQVFNVSFLVGFVFQFAA